MLPPFPCSTHKVCKSLTATTPTRSLTANSDRGVTDQNRLREYHAAARSSQTFHRAGFRLIQPIPIPSYDVRVLAHLFPCIRAPTHMPKHPRIQRSALGSYTAADRRALWQSNGAVAPKVALTCSQMIEPKGIDKSILVQLSKHGSNGL